jgi:hypothetical protein
MPVLPRQPVLFKTFCDKPIVIQFSVPSQSSDGGALLLKAVDERLGLTKKLAAAIRDRRQPGKTEHSLIELLRQRIFAIACGYPEGSAAARIGDDPVMRHLCGRGLEGEDALASQPTLSRWENQVTATDLLRMSYALTDLVIETERRRRKPRKVRRITIDLDPTVDPTYGGQQLSLFNGHYDTWCYLPLVVTIQIDDEPEEHLVAVMLRPGTGSPVGAAKGLLQRLVPKLQEAFPRAKILVRGDNAFCAPEFLDWLEGGKLEYLINLAKNDGLKGKAERWMKEARARAQETGATARVFGEFWHKTKDSWARERRIVVKAEVTILEEREPRDNPRFVVTNRKGSPPSEYARYADRGDMENRIKELKLGLRMDLTSCERFLANQFRVLLTAAAYVLYQELRRAARGTELAGAQVSTMRERLIKIGVRVTESVRRIFLEGPRAYAWQSSWRKIALAFGALSG